MHKQFVTNSLRLFEFSVWHIRRLITFDTFDTFCTDFSWFMGCSGFFAYNNIILTWKGLFNIHCCSNIYTRFLLSCIISINKSELSDSSMGFCELITHLKFVMCNLNFKYKVYWITHWNNLGIIREICRAWQKYEFFSFSGFLLIFRNF